MIPAIWVLPIAAIGATDVQIRPSQPTACQQIQITVTRTFTSDCGWVAVPEVETDGSEIRVTLTLKGNDICLPVVREKELPFDIGPFPAGDYVLLLSWSDADAKPFYEGALSISAGTCTPFVRGDVNADAAVDLGDAVTVLSYLFTSGSVACEAASDMNADGIHDLGDAVSLLNHLFADGPAPAAPYPKCGLDTTGRKPLPCAKSPCPPLPSDLVWMARADGCVQCEPCVAPEIEQVVADLEEIGVLVVEWKYVYVPVCMACHVCASGRLYAVLVPEDDVRLLKPGGWTIWEGEIIPEIR
ncbi:MAG: dockerin type I repeat-containing protein [Planctomycetes bacterium]|nr:dockerin type I repeat-containing protein [Planctomycetota bacterium]